MNQQEIITYMQSGLTSADIANLMLAEKAMSAPAPAPVAPATAPAPAPAPAPVAPAPAPVAPAPAPVAPAPAPAPAPAIGFVQQLADLGASLQQPTAQQPPAPTVQNQPNITPANAGITPEEATKLFQAWSLGQATQNVELPPTADEVLANRFNSLYGVDTTKTQQK